MTSLQGHTRSSNICALLFSFSTSDCFKTGGLQWGFHLLLQVSDRKHKSGTIPLKDGRVPPQVRVVLFFKVFKITFCILSLDRVLVGAGRGLRVRALGATLVLRALLSVGGDHPLQHLVLRPGAK